MSNAFSDLFYILSFSLTLILFLHWATALYLLPRIEKNDASLSLHSPLSLLHPRHARHARLPWRPPHPLVAFLDPVEGEYSERGDFGEWEFRAFERPRVEESDEGDDEWSSYYAIDDDAANLLGSSCRSPAWFRSYVPNCNPFHERSVAEFRHVSHGYYRDVFVGLTEPAVLKGLRLTHPWTMEFYESVRMDALVMDRMTKSDRVVDLYGHCGTSLFVEVLGRELEEVAVPGSGHLKNHHLEDEVDVDPQNDFTGEEKLGFALEMAESLAELHGFEDGVIVHDDVQLCQWLFVGEKGLNGWPALKLIDFNRAVVMQWNQAEKIYCKYKNGGGNGQYRSPEEFSDQPLNEKIDVYSLGNNFYALLTGLWNFYQWEDDEVVQKKIIKRETPYIDPRYRNRSLEEGALVEIMEKCWAFDPDDRPDVFQVVAFLRDAIERTSPPTS